MACERHRDALSDVAAGTPATAALEAHLAGCEACRSELAALRRALAVVDAELGFLGSAQPSPELPARIRSDLAEPVSGAAWRLGVAWLAIAAAAALVAVLLVARRPPGPPRATAVVATPAPPVESPVPVRPETPAHLEPQRPKTPRRASAGQALVAREPEVLVPEGEIEAMRRLAASLRRRTVAPDSLLVAEHSAPLVEPRDASIEPLAIVPLDPAETAEIE